MIDDEDDDDVVNKYELELAKSRADDENISADELLEYIGINDLLFVA